MKKRNLKSILYYLSRIIVRIIPHEIRSPELFYIERNLMEDMKREVYEIFAEELKKSIRFNNIPLIQKYALDLAKENENKLEIEEDLFYLEFGVYKGGTANFFSKFVKKLYAFDSFQGFREEWEGNRPKGDYDLNKKVPKLNSNIEPVVGYVEDTLDDFLKKHNPKINFVHMDMDLYNPSKFTLERIKPYLQKGAIILFDELYNHINWKEGEYKALKETFEDSEYKYKAFNIMGDQVAIQIV